MSHSEPTKIIALLELPAEERETFIKEKPVKDMTTRELQQAIKEKKELEEKLKSVEKDNIQEKYENKLKEPPMIGMVSTKDHEAYRSI